MGGIFAVISRSTPVAPIIRHGLERLVHRGTDGAGIATLYNGKIYIKKDAGRIKDVNEKLNLDDMPGYIGIGHIRSATHGRPVYENTHPLLDCSGNIAVVMDGVISNYSEVKSSLEPRHAFSSRTDAEVIAHIAEDAIASNNDIQAAMGTIYKLPGYFTALLLDGRNARIYALVAGNPLVVAWDGDEVIISSEEQALPSGKWQIQYVEPGQFAVVGEDMEPKIVDVSTLNAVTPKPEKVQKIEVEVSKGSFSHFMLKEIYDTPEEIARAASILQVEYLQDAWLMLEKSRNVMIIGSGTSYHAALIGRHYLNSMGRIDAESIPAGEFLYNGLSKVEPGTLIIAISQSGESADIIRSVRMAKRRGAIVLGIVNRLGSTLMRESNVYLPIGTGPEMAVPATKSFTASLVTLIQLASMSTDKLYQVRNEVLAMVPIIENELNEAKVPKKMLSELSQFSDMYVISGGPLGLPLAMEAALKLKEAAQIHAEALSFREFKHGPMTLIGAKFPVVAIMPGGSIDGDMEPILNEVWHKGGYLVVMSQEGRKTVNDYLITVNRVNDNLILPLIYAPLIQLLAYRLGTARGVDIDNPRNISKVVTA